MVAFFDEGDDGPFEGAHVLPNEPNRPYVLSTAPGGVTWANVSLLSIEHPAHPVKMCPLVRACSCKMRPCEGHFDELWEHMDLDDILYLDWKRPNWGGDSWPYPRCSPSTGT